MSRQGPRFALVHDGQVFVCLSSQDMSGNWETMQVSGRWGENEVPFERRTRGANQHFGYWFAGPGEDAPEALVLRPPERQQVIAYRLTDDRLAGQMSAELTPEQYRPLWDNESPDYDPVAVKVYEAVTEPYTPEPTVIHDLMRLDAEPWPETDLQWVAKLPYELTYQAEYLHLFPGHIEGNFKKELHDLLNARSDVSYCFDNPGHLEITVSVGRVSHKIEWRPPYRIEAATFAEALTKRKAAIKAAEAAVAEIAAHVCPTCGGSGTDLPAPVTPKRRRRR